MTYSLTLTRDAKRPSAVFDPSSRAGLVAPGHQSSIIDHSLLAFPHECVVLGMTHDWWLFLLLCSAYSKMIRLVGSMFDCEWLPCIG